MSDEAEHCPTPDCSGVDSFFRYVVDYVACDLDGETGEFQGEGDGGQLQEQHQGIFCSVCDKRVSP